MPLLPCNPVGPTMGEADARVTKYVFVTGGVVSALGKGIVAASLGRLLKARGLRVQLQKFDPYLNVDPGTMSPFQYGEVFVTEDGADVEVGLGPVLRDEDLAVLERAHRPWVHVEVGIELLELDAQPACFQQATERSGDDSLPER